ncbi:MAG: Holliday junction resolvase RecU, partial [Longicatena sp.]
RAIDFEAKETRAKTSFPFKSIHPHQIEHLKKVLYHGGIGFFIIRFTSLDETYLIDAPIIIELYESLEQQSISYKKTKEVGSLIQQGLTPRLRYLDNVDKLYFQEKNK